MRPDGSPKNALCTKKNAIRQYKKYRRFKQCLLPFFGERGKDVPRPPVGEPLRASICLKCRFPLR